MRADPCPECGREVVGMALGSVSSVAESGGPVVRYEATGQGIVLLPCRHRVSVAELNLDEDRVRFPEDADA